MNNENSIRSIVRTGILVLVGAFGTFGAVPALAAADGEALLRTTCTACHAGEGGVISRISGQRKSPEGWQMTITRMQTLHGVQVTPEDKRALIKHLADTRGLAPAEAAPWRYLLEHDNNRVEQLDDAYAPMCARCHSGARFGLQRRSAQEWELLVHGHMGLNPTLELHSMARDRPWFKLALEQIVPALARDFPLDSASWRDWQAAVKPALGGSWRIVGQLPGKGEFEGRMTATPIGQDRFALRIDGRHADGRPLGGEGSATVYTGYEWRASVNIDGVALRQVMAADAQGRTMSGRLHLADSRRVGATLRALKEGAAPQLVAVMPAHLRQGETAVLTLVGSRLDGAVNLGRGVRVLEVLSRSADRIVVRARASGPVGMRDLAVGRARGQGMLAVYDRIARIEVEPAQAIARIGGPGDSQLPKVGVAYRALGYAAGTDGIAGTADDLPLGTVPVRWSTAPLDEAAAHERDHEFAGTIDANGLFTPADAGPNPARARSANNVGRLAVLATAGEGEHAVEGRGSLNVAVPDFVERALD